MRFEVYFTASEVASRFSKSRQTVARMAMRGEFGPVFQICGELSLTEAGLCAYLQRHQVDVAAHGSEAELAVRREAVARRLGRAVVQERGPFVDGIAARSQGELRRKSARQTSEVANG